jgi:hypothetical protein
MLDYEIGLSGPQPEPATNLPVPSETLVDLQSTIDQRDSGVDILAEVSEDVGGIGEYLRVVASNSKGLPGKIKAVEALRLRELSPTIIVEIEVAPRRPNTSGALIRSRDRRLGVMCSRSLMTRSTPLSLC